MAASSAADPWALPEDAAAKYDAFFTICASGGSHVNRTQAGPLFERAELPPQQMAIIWSLSDIDLDGRLNSNEFRVAMHLATLAVAGQPLPSRLPPVLELIARPRRASDERSTRMTTQPPHSPETSSGTNLIADSRITMYKVVTSAFVNAQDLLDPGVILMWMDIAACLAAERHTKTSSVTLSMDDLHFDTMVRLGATVHLEATLHKVFGTSMEVGCTVSTSQPSGRDKFVCAACFTFVALGTDGKKMRVAEALAVTPEEKFLSTIATERRAWRLKRSALELEAREGAESSQSLDVAIEEDAVLSGGCAAGGSCCEGGVEEAAPTPLVTYSMTQLVLPNMANHHGNTFGGQVMAWMAEAATVAANRQAFESVPASHLGAISHVEIALVDALQFHAKSVVGDRVVLHAKVTRVFGSSMEICVTVEAYGATSTEVRQPQHGLFTARHIHSTAYSQHGLFTTTHATLNPSHAKPSPRLHPGAPSDGH